METRTHIRAHETGVIVGVNATERQLLLTGDFTSLRRLFAKIRVNECNRDITSSTIQVSELPTIYPLELKITRMKAGSSTVQFGIPHVSEAKRYTAAQCPTKSYPCPR